MVNNRFIMLATQATTRSHNLIPFFLKLSSIVTTLWKMLHISDDLVGGIDLRSIVIIKLSRFRVITNSSVRNRTRWDSHSYAMRLIGRKFSDSVVQNDMVLWPFKVVGVNDDKPMIVVNYKGEEKHFCAEFTGPVLLLKAPGVAAMFRCFDVLLHFPNMTGYRTVSLLCPDKTIIYKAYHGSNIDSVNSITEDI
ncbi:hypothetical protein TSUD_21230 [Trifolium subterraneum]|uniref:Uncharacterized protein n=1 Tax=Trifolium subterraneum TaxID=3900 RepID=A0A2Z6MY70_TRISU|nr:hypothetical protein TSUD_21230 [Trifolium subterraneum]